MEFGLMPGSGIPEEVHGTSGEGSGSSSDREPEWGSEQEERDSSWVQDLNSSSVEESDRGSEISFDSSEHIFVRMARHLEEQVSGHNLDTCTGVQVNFLCQLPLDILTLVASFADTLGNCKDLCQTCSHFREYRVLAASFAVMHDRGNCGGEQGLSGDCLLFRRRDRLYSFKNPHQGDVQVHCSCIWGLYWDSPGCY